MQKIRPCLIRSIIGIVALGTLYLALASFLEPWVAGGINRWYTLLFCAVYALVLFGIYRALLRMDDRAMNMLLIFCILITFLLQMSIACNMKLVPKTDLSHVIDQCIGMLEHDSLLISDVGYYGFYPNNIPVTIVVYWVFRLGRALGCTDYRMVGGIFNVLLLLITYLSANYMLKCYVSKRTQTFVMLLLLTNPVYYAYASFYYTDTVSLAFMTAGAALFAAGIRQTKKAAGAACFVAAGILLMAALKIRMTCAFLPVALAVYYLLRGKWKHLLQRFLLMLIGIGIFAVLWGGIYRVHVDFDTTDTAAPLTHWLMMGSNGETCGRFNGKDVRFTKKLKTHEEKVEKTTDKMIKRVKKNGFVGNVLLILKKELRVWSIGPHAYTTYTENVVEENIYYEIFNGRYGDFTRAFMQAQTIILLTAMTAGLFLLFRRPEENQELLLFVIYFGGGLLFYVFWEAHARHSVSFLVFLTFLTIPAVQRVFGEGKTESAWKQERGALP